jgi:hypothetical protein
MTYTTIVEEMFQRFPELLKREEAADALENSELPFVVFGDLFVKWIEKSVEASDQEVLKRIGVFLEDASLASRKDAALENLVAIEIGEWLGFMRYEQRLAPYLGPETRRVTGYVEGLATQRRAIKGFPC